MTTSIIDAWDNVRGVPVEPARGAPILRRAYLAPRHCRSPNIVTSTALKGEYCHAALPGFYVSGSLVVRYAYSVRLPVCLLTFRYSSMY